MWPDDLGAAAIDEAEEETLPLLGDWDQSPDRVLVHHREALEERIRLFDAQHVDRVRVVRTGDPVGHRPEQTGKQRGGGG